MRASADTTAGHGRLELLCVLRQQIFWSLGLAANPTWSSPQDSREKEGEKERERGIEKKAEDPLRTLVLDLSGFIRLAAF